MAPIGHWLLAIEAQDVVSSLLALGQDGLAEAKGECTPLKYGWQKVWAQLRSENLHNLYARGSPCNLGSR